jgi:hypothetical protein
MKHLTLIPRSNQVYIDRECMEVDLSDMDQAIHCVQWSEAHQRGEIEFENDPYAPPDRYKLNQPIESCEPFQKYIDRWTVAKVKWDEDQRKLQEALNAQTSAG